jgi:hypothetical protein
LVWRHQRLVWWIFVLNMVLAWLGSLPARVTLSSVLDHSLESANLVNGFDVGTFVLMLERPDVPKAELAPAALGVTLVFLVYLLFIDGGVFSVFLDDRKLSRAEFFENAGLFFWRMVRLTLYSVIPFGLLVAAHGGINSYAEKLSSDAPQERLGFFVNLACGVLLLIVALFVRMWFDLTQACVVRDNERMVFRTLLRNLKLALHSGKLFASYLGIGLFAVATFGIGVGIWVLLPHRAMGASFVVLELVTIKQIAYRLWLKAASARWVALGTGEAALPLTPEPVPAVEAPAHLITDVPPPLPDPPFSE